MTIPIVTVFNPFFLSILFQLTSSYHVWRILFSIPFGIVAVIGGWFFLSGFRDTAHRRIVEALIRAAIGIVLIIDVATTQKSPFLLRTLTIQPSVGNGLDIHAWPELLEFLNTLEEPTNIVTGPVSGYFIRGATKHNVGNFKFHNSFNSVALDKVFKGVRQNTSCIPN